MPDTNADVEFLMETNYVIPVHADMQRTIESALHVFQEATMDCCMEMMVEAKVFSILECRSVSLQRQDNTCLPSW